MKESTLNRRQILAGSLAATATIAAAGSGAAQQKEHVHSDPHHPELSEAAHHCIRNAEDCLDHCLQQLKAGDPTLADCAERVTETAAMCRTLATFASLDSARLAEVAALTEKVCGDCEKECRKHDHHMSCMLCAESCAACSEECRKLA